MLTIVEKSKVGAQPRDSQLQESELRHSQLRGKAEEQLQTGTKPATGRWSIGIDALRLLHKWSSNPDNADDALKLLHELQVHQVELDLQNEEIASNERALIEDLSLYRTLFDDAPMGYFLVDPEGEIILGNAAAAKLIGVARNDIEGYAIDTFLHVDSRPQLFALLRRVAQSGAKGTCLAYAGRGGAGASRQLQFQASMSAECEHILLTCCECAIDPREEKAR